eukprot:scaffold30642_cov90-Isochrysis_galbana.AAC.1
MVRTSAAKAETSLVSHRPQVKWSADEKGVIGRLRQVDGLRKPESAFAPELRVEKRLAPPHELIGRQAGRDGVARPAGRWHSPWAPDRFVTGACRRARVEPERTAIDAECLGGGGRGHRLRHRSGGCGGCGLRGLGHTRGLNESMAGPLQARLPQRPLPAELEHVLAEVALAAAVGQAAAALAAPPPTLLPPFARFGRCGRDGAHGIRAPSGAVELPERPQHVCADPRRPLVPLRVDMVLDVGGGLIAPRLEEADLPPAVVVQQLQQLPDRQLLGEA